MTLLSDTLVGRSGRAQMLVTEADTAVALCAGDVPVLGTSRLIQLCEEATVNAVRSALPEGWASVAKRVRIDHLAPTNVGSTVTAEASLERTEGRRLIFTVTAFDDGGLIGAGKITLVAVDRERFLNKAH